MRHIPLPARAELTPAFAESHRSSGTPYKELELMLCDARRESCMTFLRMDVEKKFLVLLPAWHPASGIRHPSPPTESAVSMRPCL